MKVTLVNIALGNLQSSQCAAGLSGATEVNIALIVGAVDRALEGCSAG
jgi:hypothetical protein